MKRKWDDLQVTSCSSFVKKISLPNCVKFPVRVTFLVTIQLRIRAGKLFSFSQSCIAVEAERDEFHLHLKRLPSIASGAISIQSYAKNTKMVYSATAKIM